MSLKIFLLALATSSTFIFAGPTQSIEQSAPLQHTLKLPADLFAYYAEQYNVNAAQLRGTCTCESGLDPKAIGDGGTSIGICQIHLPAHPDITYAQALSPAFSIRWTAQQFAAGNQRAWTCWRNKYGYAAS